MSEKTYDRPGLIAHNIYNAMNRHARAVIIAAALLLTAVFISLCFNQNIHIDEAYSMDLIQNDYQGIISGTALSQHPPLYYLIARTAALLFPTETYRLQVQKFVTILPVTLTLLLGSFWIHKKTDRVLSGLLFDVSLSFLICTMEYAVQIRMYSWGLFFVTMCGLEAYEAYDSEKLKHWILFALFGVAAAYTHNYAFVSAVIICGLFFLAILICKRRLFLKWLITVVLMLVAYLPWLFVLIRQFLFTATSDYWIPEITWETILGYFTWAFGLDTAYSTAMILLLFVLGGVIGLIALCRTGNALDIFSILCWLVPTLTATAGIVVSLLTEPIYYNRYVYPALGLLCVFFALSWRHAENWYQLVLLLFCCVIGAERYKEAIVDEYLTPKTNLTIAYLEENLSEEDIVVYNFSSNYLIYEFYVNIDQMVDLQDVDWGNLQGDAYFFYTYNFEQISQSTLDAYGLVMEEEGVMGVEQNDFTVYHIYKAE